MVSATLEHVPPAKPASFRISIHYNEKQNLMYGNELRLNLEDLVYSLNKILCRRHNAKATGKLHPSRVDIIIEGTTPETVKPYLEAFQTWATRRRRFFLLVKYDLA